MKDKLKVGMYARTDLGEIGKITSVASDDVLGTGEMTFYNSEPYLKGNETKASYNIIDLIEVGDVIIDKEGHKYPINYEFETDYNDEYKSYEITIDDHITLFFKDGLSIVTKEQFESMEYRLGDE